MLSFAGVVRAGRAWGLYGRMQYTVIALTALAVLWSLNYWNLIVYRFG